MCGIPSWAKRNPEKWEQIEFNKNFLKSVEKKYEWYENKNDNVATVDHFLPSSKFKELKKNPNNFVVSCDSCNNKKSDDIWEIVSIKYPITENKLQILTELNYVKD